MEPIMEVDVKCLKCALEFKKSWRGKNTSKFRYVECPKCQNNMRVWRGGNGDIKYSDVYEPWTAEREKAFIKRVTRRC